VPAANSDQGARRTLHAGKSVELREEGHGQQSPHCERQTRHDHDRRSGHAPALCLARQSRAQATALRALRNVGLVCHRLETTPFRPSWIRTPGRIGPPPEDNDVSKEIRQRMGAGPGGDYTQGAAEHELPRLGVALAQPPEPAPVAAPLPRGPCKRRGRPPRRRRSRQQRSASSPGLCAPIRICWTTPAVRRDAAKPTYLIVAAPSAVRFAGTGFFALGPDSEGPAGLPSAARPCALSCRCTRYSPRRAG
jgi:hypothetical protein